MQVAFYGMCFPVRVAVLTVQVPPAIPQHAAAVHRPDQVQIRAAAAGEMPPGEIINKK